VLGAPATARILPGMTTGLLLRPPPRHVPTSLRIRVLFGGVLQVFGWVFLGIGMFLVMAFVANSELLTAAHFDGPLVTAQGRVLRSEPTSMTVNKSAVHRVDFEFSVGDTSYRGVSYTPRLPPQPPQQVVVEYARGTPSVACIQGMQSAALPAGVGFVLVFPLAGLVLVAIGLWQGHGRARLLQQAVTATGRLIRHEHTNARVNGRRVMRLTFAFTGERQQTREVVARSNRHELMDESTPRTILYEPSGDAAAVVDALPGPPRAGAGGEWLPMPATEVLRVLALPAFAVLLALLGPLVRP
jgi:hypothetical protein